MATRVTAGSTLALELSGAKPLPLRSAQPPGRRIERAATGRTEARVALGELALSAELAESGPLLDWLGAVQDGASRPTDAALLVADANRKLQRRLDLRGLLLTGAEISPLSASAGRSTVALALRCQPQALAELPGGGGTLAPLGSRRKALSSANFRVVGLPFDGAGVRDVVLPTLSAPVQRSGGRRPSVKLASVVLGPLSLTLSGRSLAPARAWLAKALDAGGLAAEPGLTLAVELLDAALKQTQARITLTDCALSGVDESPLAAADDAPPTLTLAFSAAHMAIELAA